MENLISLCHNNGEIIFLKFICDESLCVFYLFIYLWYFYLCFVDIDWKLRFYIVQWLYFNLISSVYNDYMEKCRVFIYQYYLGTLKLYAIHSYNWGAVLAALFNAPIQLEDLYISTCSYKRSYTIPNFKYLNHSFHIPLGMYINISNIKMFIYIQNHF